MKVSDVRVPPCRPAAWAGFRHRIARRCSSVTARVQTAPTPNWKGRLVENTPAPRRPPQRSRLSVVLFEPERTPPAFVFTTKTGRQSPEGEVYARSRFSPCSECAVSVPAS